MEFSVFQIVKFVKCSIVEIELFKKCDDSKF